jgi:hypothetical protein
MFEKKQFQIIKNIIMKNKYITTLVLLAALSGRKTKGKGKKIAA